MKKALIFLSILGMALGITAFQCASAELTGAKLYINQKQYEKAKEALQKDIAKNPNSDEGWYLLGYIYGEEGNIPEMLNAFDKSLSISDKYKSQIEDSKKYYWATSFNKGVNFFNKASNTASKDTMQIFFEQAAEQFKNSILCQPDSSVGYINLVYTYLNMNKIDDAIEPLEKLTSLGNSAEAFSMLGQIYTEKGNTLIDSYRESKNEQDSVKAYEYFDKAISVLEKGRDLFPDDNEILLRLSNAYISANKLDVALEAFKKGVEKDPENKFYQYNLGVLLLNANDFEGAEKHFKKAIELDPQYTNAIYNLAVTYIRWGAKIREEMEQNENVKIDETKYKEKFQAAIPYLEKYLEVNPNEAAIWELLGKVHANLGNEEKSAEAFNKADQLRK
ncbi:tetratricopeptide repeat protein [Melioribacter sp. OK-6-Me]|uniref:tetratricopeptide repeat protein n=1 Tax=unclassified Melioribacter TaxID=2627329 RepID=UPI003ED91599